MKKILLFVFLGFTAKISAQIPSYVPTNGLVAWYSFTGNANDVSGNGNNGTVNGATLSADRFGNTNSAYSFNGANNDYIEVPDNSMFQAESASWSIWVKISNPSGGNGYGIMSKGSDLTSFFLIVEYQNSLGTQIVSQPGSGIGVQSNIDILDGAWHNVVATYDNNLSADNISLYIDGIFQQSATYDNFAFNLNNGLPIRIGRSIDAFWQSFTGLADDIGIWNRTLTSSEVLASYQGCAFVNQPTNQSTIVGNDVQFIVSSSDSNAAYQWQSDSGFGFQNLSNAGQYSGTTNEMLTVSNVTISNNNQVFRCIVTSDECTDTSEVATLTVTNSTGTDDLLEQNDILVYPNPTNGEVTVEVNRNLIGAKYIIKDPIGRVVLCGKLFGEKTNVNLSRVASGVYFLMLQGQEGTRIIGLNR
jgi:hypothetical protein